MSLLRALAVRMINLILILFLVLIVIAAVLSGPASKILSAEVQLEASSIIQSYLRTHPTANMTQVNYLKQQIITQLENAYGLNKPPIVRLFYILYNVLSFNWGYSYFPNEYGVPSGRVTSIIMSALPGTVILDTLGILLSALIGIEIGLRAALRYGSALERVVTYYGAIDNGIPQWWIGILMILAFAVGLRLIHSPIAFPYGGIVSPQYFNTWLHDPIRVIVTPQMLSDLLYHLTLPMATVLIANVGLWAYFARTIVLNIIREDYVYFARVKGLPSNMITSKYVMRPALPQILTSIFITIPFVLFGGFLITEIVFQWWGLGYVLNIAIVGVPSPDTPVILAVTYMETLLYIVLVFILEILYYVLDPRIRESAMAQYGG